jgi:hypothetical protein
MSNFSYPNNQYTAAGAIPVYIVGAQPTPDGKGRFPIYKSNPNGAMPVHVVAQPTLLARYPNDKSQAGGAIPVRVLANPGGGPKWSSDQGLSNGAIPVWDVGSIPTHALKYPSNQAIVASAIPVWRVN